MTFNWWQSAVVGIVIFSIGFGIRHLTYPDPPKSEPIVKYVPGVADTVFLPSEPLQGSNVDKPIPEYDQEEDNAVSDLPRPLKRKSIYTHTTNSSLSDTNKVKNFSFQSKTHIYADSSTLRDIDSVVIDHSWTIEPRPAMIIARVDTMYVPTPIEVPARVPFLEKPTVVAIITGTAAVLGTIFIINNTRK